ncbi:MAG: sulfotransferase [Bacteroidetes bacterium]|nr:sulfotransferase [Bacteroidota bacterium]
MDLKKLDDIKINFIIGPGRSGTTLLSVMLNEYPNCISAPEIHHFIFFYKKYHLVSIVTDELVKDVKEFITLFYNLKKNPLFGAFNSFIIDKLKIGESINYSQLTKLIYLGLYGEKGTSSEINFIIDKNPFYTLQIDKIAEVFPEAKFIALIRDYRGYALSINESVNPLLKKKSIYYHALVWNMYLDTILKAKTKYGDKIKIVKYEDLVINKEICIKDTVNFLGLTFSETIYNFHETMKIKISELESPEKINPRLYKRINDLTSPIHTNRLNSWESNLSKKEIKILDFLSGEIGLNFNYLKASEISFFEKISFTIAAIQDRIKVKIYEYLKSPDFALYYNYQRKNK